MPDGIFDDPLSSYSLIDSHHAPKAQAHYPRHQIAVKSMVLPDFIHTYHIHSATVLQPYKATYINGFCMGLVSREILSVSCNRMLLC